MNASDILARQQLKEAWDTTLKQAGWAEQVRQSLHDPPQLETLLRSQPSLGMRWTDALRQLRRGPQDWNGYLETLQELLSPPDSFVLEWQARQPNKRRFRVPLTRVDAQLWRSPQPTLHDLAELKQQGLEALFNLRRECDHSQIYCEQVGLVYRHLPVPDMGLPDWDQMREFLDYFASPQPTPVLLHCYAGQGRTGLFAACYRIFRGVPLEEAIQLSDRESRCRGMRPHQREWVRTQAERLPRLTSES